MLRLFLMMAMSLFALAVCTWAETSTLINPTRREYPDELVRLKATVPKTTFIVTKGGVQVPYQVEEIDGVRRIWVCATFAAKENLTFEVSPGTPKDFPPRVTVKRDGNYYLLDNGITAVRIPAVIADPDLGPIAGIKLGEDWVGGSTWQTDMKIKAFNATVIADGLVFGKVRLRYEFDSMAGSAHDVPSFAEIDVSLAPGQKHVVIAERHEMAQHDSWEFEASRGWKPTTGRGVPHSGGAGSGEVGKLPEKTRALLPGAVPLAADELFLNLFPRWNQHYKDGWSFAAFDDKQTAGAMVVRSGQWIWPHDNSIRAVVKATGDYAGLRAPTWRGARMWWLLAGPVATTPLADINYITVHDFEPLDKLNEDFILTWPGKTGDFQGMNLHDGGQMNPTGGIRGAGRNAIASAGKLGDFGTLTKVQTMFHPDTYGNYWLHWSPENPNFYTDFTRVPIALTAQLREHPQFEKFRKQAEMTMREDLYNSVTMPSGAGQECPGYLTWALKGWSEVAPVTKQYLGFDPREWPEYKAAERF